MEELFYQWKPRILKVKHLKLSIQPYLECQRYGAIEIKWNSRLDRIFFVSKQHQRTFHSCLVLYKSHIKTCNEGKDWWRWGHLFVWVRFLQKCSNDREELNASPQEEEIQMWEIVFVMKPIFLSYCPTIDVAEFQTWQFLPIKPRHFLDLSRNSSEDQLTSLLIALLGGNVISDQFWSKQWWEISKY